MSAPDIDSVEADDWPRRDFPLEQPRRNRVRVVVRQSVLNAIYAHGQSRRDIEICGVMIGRGYQDEDGPFIYVEHIIQGEHSDGHTAEVTFTDKTWDHIHTTQDREFPDTRMVGWYHTHPGFGIFLSEQDMFIHKNYFGASDQMAFVYDPINGEEGLFLWRKGEPSRETFLVEPDEPGVVHESKDKQSKPALTANARRESKAEKTPPRESSATNEEVLQRIERIELRQRQGLVALLLVTLMAVIAPAGIWIAIHNQLPMWPFSEPVENPAGDPASNPEWSDPEPTPPLPEPIPSAPEVLDLSLPDEFPEPPEPDVEISGSEQLD